MADFIGKAALQHIADNFSSQILMGAAHFRPEELDRMGFKITSGVQFKDTITVMNRKGGTTRRKVVGQTVANKAGYLEERPLVARLTWNRYWDNQDSYIETPYQVPGSAEYSYPMSEIAFKAIMANYGEDIFSCLFWGDETYDKDDEKLGRLSLFNGIHKYLADDVAKGRISLANGNLQHINAIIAPVDSHDFAAWTIFEDLWTKKVHPALKTAPKVKVLCSSATGVIIANAYANKWHGNQGVKWLDNGNFAVPEYKNVEFVPSDFYGEGDKLMIYVDQDLEYGVNSLDSRNKIIVQTDFSDRDALDVAFQVQSVQGVRVINVNPSHFCMTDGTLQEGIVFAGDYQKDNFAVVVNDATLGSVTVNGQAPDNDKEYPANTTLTLVAIPAAGAEFKNWSDGNTNTTRTVVTNGNPAALMAFFKSNTSSSSE